jgi:uncharacterized protein (DUF4415 family)
MADGDIRQCSLEEIEQMDAQGLIKETAADAPEIEPDEEFWRNARVVGTGAPHRTLVKLQLDAATVEFFRAGGRGHLGRMAEVLDDYARSHAAPAEHPAG